MGGALVLHGLELRFGAGAGDLLPVQFVVQFAALLFQARALGLLPHQFVAGGDRFIVQLAEALAQFLDLAAAGEQVRHPRLHAAAGHRAAGVHDVALERHQTERIAPGALYADAGFEVFRHHRAAEEVVDHAAILFVKADQLRGHAQAAGQLQHLALARVEHAGAHRADGQKCGAAEAVVAQVFDHALGVLVALDDDVLQSAAQHHVDGALQLFRHFDQLRHHAVHARRAALAGVEQHLLDRVLVALVVVLHLHEQFEARIGALALAHDGVDALGELLALLRGSAHLLDGGGHFALKARLALAFLLHERLRGGELLVQRARARLGALAVLVHGGKLALQRRAQRFQARLLIAHVAQAVHGLDDLFLLGLGLFLEGGKFFLELGKLRLAGACSASSAASSPVSESIFFAVPRRGA